MPPELEPSTLKKVCDAVRYDDWTTVEALIEADPRLVDNEDYNFTMRTTLLHEAALQGNSDIVRWLIEERKCNIATRNAKGGTVLHLATLQARHWKIPVVEYLFERHAPEDANHLMELLNQLYKTEDLTLEVFCCVLRCTSIETLNYMDHRFYTPLTSACIKGYAKVARLLLFAGAEAYETYPFNGTNAVKWDPGNRNALLKAQAVFRNDSAEVRAAKERCVALIEVGD